MVEAFHALGCECVFFEYRLEVVDCVWVEAHGEAEEAGLGDDGVKFGQWAGEVGGVVGVVVVESDDGPDMRPDYADDVIDVVGEIDGQ